MLKFKFNKLVRDKIPELLQQEGIIVQAKTLTQDEYIDALKQKLIEEATEVLAAKDKKEICEELGDITEVLYAIYEAAGITYDEVDKSRIKKNNEKGIFEKKLYIESIEIEDEHKDIERFLSQPEKYPKIK